jgi:hypothetical protein
MEGMREGVTEQDDAAARSQQRLHPQLQRLHARHWQFSMTHTTPLVLKLAASLQGAWHRSGGPGPERHPPAVGGRRSSAPHACVRPALQRAHPAYDRTSKKRSLKARRSLAVSAFVMATP